MTATMYRANVTRVDTDGVMVEIRDLGVGSEYGPCPLLNIQELNVGDDVLVGNLFDVPEEMVVFGKLMEAVDIPDPVPPVGAGFLLAYENAAARNAAVTAPVSGVATWLDDEQRLEIYTDEGTPGWTQLYVFRSGVTKLPLGAMLAINTAVPNATFDVTGADAEDSLLLSRQTGDAASRFRVTVEGAHTWGDGTVADTEVFRESSAGLRVNPGIGINGAPSATTRLSITNGTTTRRGVTIQSTVTGQTAAHIYVISNAGSTTAPLLASLITGESVERLAVLNSGQMQWSDGATAADVSIVRNSTGPGLQVTPRLAVGGTPATTASYTARQSTNRVGFFSNNTEAATTHSLAHFYAVEAGNTDSRFIASYMSADTTSRFAIESSGKVLWGPGGVTVPDTNLYRVSAGLLKTDQDFNIGRDLIVTRDVNITGDVIVGDELTVDNHLYLGPDAFEMGWGIVAQDGDSGNSAAIEATETVVLTLPSRIYRAGRCFSIEVLGRVQYQTSTPVAAWKVRKTNAAGTQVVDFGRTMSGGTGVAWPVNLKTYFQVGVSDVTTVLVLTLQGGAANSATHVGPRVFTVKDEGLASQFDAPLTLS